MIKICRTKDTTDISNIIILLNKYFKPYELVNSDEIYYYVHHYSEMYPKEDYFI